jgi:hypothetical protein
MAAPAPTMLASLLPSVYISMGYVFVSLVSVMAICRAGCGHSCTGRGLSYTISLVSRPCVRLYNCAFPWITSPHVCVRACVRARVRVCVCVCVCEQHCYLYPSAMQPSGRYLAPWLPKDLTGEKAVNDSVYLITRNCHTHVDSIPLLRLRIQGTNNGPTTYSGCL